MATKEIKTRFKLEGEQQFKRTMSESAAAVKVLNSEEKLAEAQFKATGDAQTYAAEKSRILREQIKQQETAVKAAEEAVKKLTEQGVQPNAREMQQWKTKLNNARTNLANMQTKLNAVENELGEQKTAVTEAKDATEGYNTEMGKVAEGVNLQNTITAIDNLKGHIESVVKKAAQAAKAVWEMGADAGKWADDLITASTQAGVDVETWQSWQYASRFIDTSVQDILKNQQDIDKKFKEDSKTAEDYAAAMREVGVATHDAGGNLRGSRDMFWDAIDALHGISDADELARRATKLFGNDWRNLQPLIEAGSQAYQDMANQGRDVAVVSADQVAALGAVDDAVQDMNARFDKLKYESLAAMAPTFQTVAEAMSTATDALNEFIASEEGQAALSSLNEALSGIISSFLGEDGGKGTFESIVTGAKDAVTKLTDALDWISRNGEVISGVITGLGAAWAGLTVTKEVLLFMQLLKATPLSKLGAMFGGKAAASAAGGAGGTGNAVPEAANMAGAGLTGAMAALTAATSVYLKGAATQWDENMEAQSAAKEAGDAMVEEVKRTGDIVAEKLGQETADLRNQMVAKATEAMVPVLDTTMGAVPGIGMTVTPTTANRSALIETIEYMKANAATIEKLLSPETYNSIMTANPNGGFLGIGSMGNEDLLALVQKAADEMVNAGRDAGDGLVEGFEESKPAVETSAKDVADVLVLGVRSTLDEHSPSKVMEDIGAMAAVGLAQGINSRAGDAIRAAQSLADRVTAIMRQALQIHSPSAVFAEMGEMTGEGFALGLEQSAARVNRAAGRMLGAVSGASRIAPAGVSEGGWSYGTPAGRTGLTGAAGAIPEKVQVTVMVDKDVLAETTVPLVDAMMGARLNAVRR